MELNERVKVESKGVKILNYDEALAWCVMHARTWEGIQLNDQAPRGWEWIRGIKSWIAPSCGGVKITEADWIEAKKMAVTAEEKLALVDEEFTGHSDLKKYVFKVKLVKTGEDYKALSVVGISMENILNIIFHADYEGWIVVSVNRGSIIDIC